MGLNLGSVLLRNEGQFLSSDLGDEIVMMDLSNGNYIGLNDVGSEIWQLLEAPKTIADVISELVANYEVEEEECTKDVMEYLTDMLERGIVSIK